MGSYYDVDAILTDAHKVPCTFEIDIPGLGYLDENPGGDIKANHAVSLPLWLSTLLAVQRLGPSSKPLCSLDLPTSLSTRVINALKADPRTVDLRNLAGHYYELAVRILELFDEDEIVDVLTDSFKTRAAKIADHASNLQGAQGGEGQEFLRGLDQLEEQLFRGTHESAKAMRIWLGEAKKREHYS